MNSIDEAALVAEARAVEGRARISGVETSSDTSEPKQEDTEKRTAKIQCRAEAGSHKRSIEQ
jgi:hypothetical protein